MDRTLKIDKELVGRIPKHPLVDSSNMKCLTGPYPVAAISLTKNYVRVLIQSIKDIINNITIQLKSVKDSFPHFLQGVVPLVLKISLYTC